MSDATKHQGGCHCGKVRYEVGIDLSKPVISCNCSMCGKTGTLLAFVPASEFRLLTGEDSLKDYRFNRNVISHLFCTTCGVKSFARGKGQDGKDVAAVNVRCLDDVDVEVLDVHKFDGKSV